MDQLMPSAQQILDLDDESLSSISAENAAHNVIQTIYDELCEYTQAEPLPLNEFLQQNGYTGPEQDAYAVKAFLLSSLQARRMLNHRDNSFHTYSSRQHQLSTNLTRILHSMDITPPRSEPQSLSSIIDHINQRVRDSKFDINTELQTAILSDEDCSVLLEKSRLEMASKTLSQLQKEQATRIGLLLTRLHVTTLSFSRAPKAQEKFQTFSALSSKSQHLRSKWSHPHPISLFESLTARKYLLVDKQLHSLIPEKMITASVKDYIMGNVPDRGGRIAARLEMPGFQERVEGENSDRKGSNYQRKKASGKGRRRK